MTASLNVPVLCPVLIGRASQLESLSWFIEHARGGIGQTVMIAGEAGVGKSRLVEETKTRALQHGFSIFQGSCFEPDRGFPYAPLLDLLGSFCSNHSSAEIASVLGVGAPELLKLLPELAAHLPDLRPAPPLEPEAEKRRLFHALTQIFTSKGAFSRGPLLIVIEDLHWSDDTSLEFLLHLARRLVSQSVVLLLTYRSDETHYSLNHFLATLDREHLTRELNLQRLTMAEVDGMLRAIYKIDRPVSAAFQQTLYALTEGNPFFIEETLKALTASGSIFLERGRWDHKPVSELHIPRSIQDTVLHRLERLSTEARHLLEIAAVAGRRVDFGLLQELTPLGEQELLSLMKEMVSAQLVVEETADQFSFRHALTREAVYLSLLIRERKRYHNLVLGTLERIYADSLDSRVGNLAYHAYEAGAWDKALEYSQQAGEKAQRLYAPHSALNQFTRALEAAQHLGVSTAVLYRDRGQTYETLGEFDKAQADYEQVLRSTGETHDNKADVQPLFGQWQALIDLGFLWAGRDYQRTGDYFRQALDLAYQIRDPSTLAHSLNRVGNWHANVGDLNEALRYHQQALDVFQEANDRRGLAETLDLLGMASQINGDLVRGTAYYLRAVELFRELDDRRGLVSGLATLALCGPSYLHDPSVSPMSLAEAIENGEQALKIAREIGWRSGEVYAMECLANCLGPQGEYPRALDLATRALEISKEIEHDQWLIGAYCLLGRLYLEMLSFSQARQYLEQALTLAQKIFSSVWIGSVTGYLASVCISQYDFSRAEAVLDDVLTSDTPSQTQMQRLCWCARVEIALARGETELALGVIDRLIASDPNVTPTATIPRLWKLRGECLVALQRPKEAERDLKTAHTKALEQGARSWNWRIHKTLGKLYQAQARHSEAEVAFGAAQAIIAELTESIQDQTLRENFLGHAMAMIPGLALTSLRRAEKKAYGGLTTREREVAALIAKGTSNREIAEMLVVSERTVESHVTNILAKLDLPSRARIAVWAIDKGLGKRVE